MRATIPPRAANPHHRHTHHEGTQLGGFLHAARRRDATALLAPNVQASWALSTLNSRRSHAFASFQSCITVSGETFSTSAVSSTLSPPKKRSSTTRLRLG